MQNRIAYHEVYNYDRLEKAARNLHIEQTEETEIGLLNLHNHLVWHSYKPGIDPVADAILSSVIAELLEERNTDMESVPLEFIGLASEVAERREA